MEVREQLLFVQYFLFSEFLAEILSSAIFGLTVNMACICSADKEL